MAAESQWPPAGADAGLQTQAQIAAGRNARLEHVAGTSLARTIRKEFQNSCMIVAKAA